MANFLDSGGFVRKAYHLPLASRTTIPQLCERCHQLGQVHQAFLTSWSAMMLPEFIQKTILSY